MLKRSGSKKSINSIFFKGPELPGPCLHSSMVTSPNKQGVILLGCQENPNTIYELVNINGTLYWRKMIQELKYPRSYLYAIPIPDHLTTCDL